MASDLADAFPSGLLERSDRFFAGDVGEARHAVRR
jgi:hypothetical protein